MNKYSQNYRPAKIHDSTIVALYDDGMVVWQWSTELGTDKYKIGLNIFIGEI